MIFVALNINLLTGAKVDQEEKAYQAGAAALFGYLGDMITIGDPKHGKPPSMEYRQRILKAIDETQKFVDSQKNSSFLYLFVKNKSEPTKIGTAEAQAQTANSFQELTTLLPQMT